MFRTGLPAAPLILKKKKKNGNSNKNDNDVDNW